MVGENKVHVELAHHVVGGVVQYCGLIVQNTPLTGAQDSILGYLTSPRFFPQPRQYVAPYDKFACGHDVTTPLVLISHLFDFACFFLTLI